MYVFGGSTRASVSENLGDMHCFDLERNEWSEVRLSNGSALTHCQGSIEGKDSSLQFEIVVVSCAVG